ncbi:hypothetical protein ACFQ3L_10855 [Lacticaseibacillus jixianensis]|uniref:Uncharacterized protein n=1 Tax=Lacticaseibacillus jixianensis TaxID=2486012 RepID=A0ABW4BCY7_9LACO|nr:hypothetical protein [Lacticaseibacillus jixianensis]
MDKLITVVYYQHGETVRLIKAFSSAKRAGEYLRMMQEAPFPGEESAGYQQTVLHLN